MPKFVSSGSGFYGARGRGMRQTSLSRAPMPHDKIRDRKEEEVKKKAKKTLKVPKK